MEKSRCDRTATCARLFEMQHEINNSFIMISRSYEMRIQRLENMVSGLIDDIEKLEDKLHTPIELGEIETPSGLGLDKIDLTKLWNLSGTGRFKP